MEKSSVLNYGSFSVSSVTRRWLDGETLKMNATSKGIYGDLKKFKGSDKDGKEFNLIEEKIEVHYEPVVKWLLDHGHADLVESAYDEREVTAQVKGPKALAFFGEKKGDSLKLPKIKVSRTFGDKQETISEVAQSDIPEEFMSEFKALLGDGKAHVSVSADMSIKDFGTGAGAMVTVSL